MAIKRSLELSGADDEHSLSAAVHEPPPKRRLLSTPKRHPLPFRPLDSPSNPFGRKRTHALTRSLPAPTSFSKHLPLRFQLVRPGLSPRLGGTHRIVQVPLSYTFVHLRCLIAFLYGEGYAPPQQDRHLFEVQKRLVMYSPTYKPGQIRSGVTTVKLSSARDPCRYRPEVDEDAFMTQSDASGEDSPAEDAEETEGWVWEAEEHFTLAHAWPRGGDLARGIVYVSLSLSKPLAPY